MKLANILYQGRKKINLPFRKLSTEIGIDAGLLNKFEKGERLPTKIQLEKLVEILGLDKKSSNFSLLVR